MGVAEWIAFFVGAIALVALGISIWQGYETRTHNRKSVIAHLSFSISFDDTGSEDPGFGITLSNAGSGPAIIDSIDISLDETPFVAKAGHPWVAVWMAAEFMGTRFLYSLPNVGDVMRPGEIVRLLKIDEGKPKQEEIAAFSKALDRVDVKLRYRSIYDEEHLASLQDSYQPWRYRPQPRPGADSN